MTVISYYDLFRFFFCFSIMLAAATHKLTNRSHFYNKELFLSHIKAQGGVLGLPLGGDSQTQAPFFMPPASSTRGPTDDLALCPLQLLARGRAWNCMWRFCRNHVTSVRSHLLAEVIRWSQWVEERQGPSPRRALRTGKRVVILQQALAFRFGGIAVSWLRMSMGYIQSAQLSWQLYFDYLSCNLPDSEIEDNNTHLKKWFRYKRQAGHIIYSNKALINLLSLLVWTERMFQAS